MLSTSMEAPDHSPRNADEDAASASVDNPFGHPHVAPAMHPMALSADEHLLGVDSTSRLGEPSAPADGGLQTKTIERTPDQTASNDCQEIVDAVERQGKARRKDLQAEEKEECRLCLEELLEGADADGGRLIHPCTCRSAVHVDCLVQWQAVQMQWPGRSLAERSARASTCEVCGSLWSVNGDRPSLPTRIAICRAHGGLDKVALRRVPTASREHGVFSEFSAAEGQELEVLELDGTGEFFRVRAFGAQSYHGSSSVAVAEGWIRRCYLEWPGVSPDPSSAATRTMLRWSAMTMSSPISDDSSDNSVDDG